MGFFAKDLLAATAPSTEGFAFGDLKQRVNFFGSPLYRDFVETRVLVRMEAMKKAETQNRRDELLTSMLLSSENMEGETGALVQKHAGWARALFSAAVAPETRLSFALACDATERVEFASQFKECPGDGVCWNAARCAVALVDLPPNLKVADFIGFLDLVHKAGARKLVTNPLLGAMCDFHSEVRALRITTAEGTTRKPWVMPLLEATAGAKMGVGAWQKDDFAPDSVPEEHGPAVSKALGRAFPMRPPMWVVQFREKVAYNKSKQAAGGGSGTPAAAADAGLVERMKRKADEYAAAAASAPAVAASAAAAPAAAASAPAAPGTSAAVAPVAAAGGVAASAAVAPAPAAPAAPAAARAPGSSGSSAAAAPQAAAVRPFHVGDVVILDDTVGVLFANQDFQCSVNNQKQKHKTNIGVGFRLQGVVKIWPFFVTPRKLR